MSVGVGVLCVVTNKLIERIVILCICHLPLVFVSMIMIIIISACCSYWILLLHILSKLVPLIRGIIIILVILSIVSSQFIPPIMILLLLPLNMSFPPPLTTTTFSITLSILLKPQASTLSASHYQPSAISHQLLLSISAKCFCFPSTTSSWYCLSAVFVVSRLKARRVLHRFFLILLLLRQAPVSQSLDLCPSITNNKE